MKLTKGAAFLLCFIAILFIFISMSIISVLKNDIDKIPVAPCLTGIGALATIYIGGSVANNGVKGRNWNQDMYDSENSQGAKG